MTGTNPVTIKDSLVLIVDDIPRNIQLLGNILSDQGFRVAVADHGLKALSIIEKIEPELVLLDVMMPEMNGFEVCKRIKSNPKTRAIPVIFLTAKNDVEDKLHGFSAGAVDFVTKPFEPAEVIARVNTQLTLKRTADLLAHQNEHLETLLEERTRALVQSERHAAYSLLIQGIIHNLKNPLNLIYAGAQFIEMERSKIISCVSGLPRQEQEELTNRLAYVWKSSVMIEKGTNQLLEMIDSMMAKSRSDQIGSLTVLNLNDLIKQEYEFMMADSAFRHTVSRNLDLSADELTVRVVPSEITQVIQNLLRNAVDSVYGREHPEVALRSGRSGDQAWFSVEDNGTGIPADYLQRIFEPFFTTKPSAAAAQHDEPVGTGLGLHICKSMIEAHDGEIRVESHLNIGTVFSVWLPMLKEEGLEMPGSAGSPDRYEQLNAGKDAKAMPEQAKAAADRS